MRFAYRSADPWSKSMRQESQRIAPDGYNTYLHAVVADVHESDVVILVSREILAAERKVQSCSRSITDEACASQPSDLCRIQDRAPFCCREMQRDCDRAIGRGRAKLIFSVSLQLEKKHCKKLRG